MKRLLQRFVSLLPACRGWRARCCAFMLIVAAASCLSPVGRAQPANTGGDIQVPNVVNKTYGAAASELRDMHLTPEPAQPGVAIDEDARVIDQSPRSGTPVRRGWRIELTVESAPPKAMVAVPRIIDMTPAQATSLLRQKGLVLDADVPGSTTRHITSQSPRAGTSVPEGSPVEAQSESITSPVSQSEVPETSGTSTNAATQDASSAPVVPEDQRHRLLWERYLAVLLLAGVVWRVHRYLNRRRVSVEFATREPANARIVGPPPTVTSRLDLP